MPGPGPKLTVLLTVLTLFGMSGVASAAPTEADGADTVFNVGYDDAFHVFFWGITPYDSEVDCEADGGATTVDFGADGAIEVDGLSDCEIEGVEIAGPQGQVNHGMFMKLFNSLYQGNHRGCLNRNLAKLGFGKGDQQIEVPAVDPDFSTAGEGDSSQVEMESFLLDCDKKSGAVDKSADRSDKANGRPDSPGKSRQAPGHNKSAG